MGIRTELEREFDYDIVDEFLDHFDVMTEVMEPTIVALENDKKRREKIDELFRLFHNIKSASSFLKLERIHLLAELAEEMMERLRSGQSEPTPEVVDWLLLVSDQMRRWYDEIESDASLSDTDPRILQIPS
ncbi:Hpt domain-containing protein [Hydrogenimonas sp.]